MILHNVTQGSPEWLSLRAGIPTASCFEKILTPGGEPSKQATAYLYKLVAERIIGRPIDTFTGTPWTERGTQFEAEAVAYYETMRDLDTVKVGFVTNDAGTVGASPDRLVGDEGVLEIKVPAPHTHVGYLLSRAVEKDHKVQVQGQLWVAERQWCDVLAYSPDGLPPIIIRVERDDEYIRKLAAVVGEFASKVEEAVAGLRMNRGEER
jgi:hypothetical protein